MLTMSDEPTTVEECDCPDPGIPAYMGTFADLMSLMLCFFVLLLSFSEMDALKFKMVVKSMEDAFGVDRPEDPETIPLATSIIQQTFSPSPNQPTPFYTQTRQSTVNETADLQIDNLKQYQMAVRNTQIQNLNQLLKDEINLNLISVETIDDRVTIRINEKASFTSGKANLKSSFIPILAKIRHSLAQTKSDFIVSGHTDNIPVNSSLYRSNWELSAARATSVVHVLLDHDELQAGRFRIEGYGSTKPLVANNSSRNRAVNRRVEISLLN
jgi:chemotaxis protein MotB